jgi:hypothetical protein
MIDDKLISRPINKVIYYVSCIFHKGDLDPEPNLKKAADKFSFTEGSVSPI